MNDVIHADAGKLQLYKDGTQFAPGIVSVFAPGHTVGHSMVRVSSGGGDSLIWGAPDNTAGETIDRFYPDL